MEYSRKEEEKRSASLWVCGDAVNDGKPRGLDAAFLSTGESVTGMLQTLCTLHPCGYSENYIASLQYNHQPLHYSAA